MYFETKIFQFEPLVSLCSFNSLQISVKAKWSNSKKIPWRRIEILVEKKTSLHKTFWLIYHEILTVTWPNFTVIKYNLKIFSIYHHIKFRKSIMNRCSITKLLLNILQYLQENNCVGVSFLMEMQDFSPVTLSKRDSNADVFLWILQNF